MGATYNIDATNAAESTYALNTDIKEPTAAVSSSNISSGTTWNISGTTGVTTTAKNVFADTKSSSDANDVPALLLIPSTAPQTLYVTVEYLVRTADSQLSKGFSEVSQTVTNSVSLTGLEVNKYYTLVMHLGLTSVKFSAIVADWANSDDASYDEGGTTDGTEEAAEEVWLPSNVIAVSTTNSSTPKLGTSYNENLKANTNSYTVNLTGLVKGQKITATFAAPITAVSIDGTALTSGTALPLTADNPAGVVAVTLTANTKVTAAKSLLKILQEDASDTDLSTTSINFIQSAFNIKLTEADGVVTVTDGDDTAVDVTNAAYTVKVYNDEGTELAESGNYTKAAAGTITMTNNGTYTVVVTYKDANDATITKTIKTTKTS